MAASSPSTFSTTLTDATERRERRRKRIAAITSLRTALLRPRKVLEEFSPWLLPEVSDLLASEIGGSFSSAAFRRVDVEIAASLGQREVENILSRYRQPGARLAVELELQAEGQRRHAAKRSGLDVLVTALDRLAGALQRELEREVLQAPDGRPAHRPPMTEMAIYDRVVALTAAGLGRRINPHLFRDCVATTIAIEDPAHVGIASQILGHRAQGTTERHYNHAQSLEAARRLQATLLHLRGDPSHGPAVAEGTP